MSFCPDDEVTHALVDFPDGNCTCVVRKARLLCDMCLLKVGDKVDMQWSKQKVYSAKLLLLGNTQLLFYSIWFILFYFSGSEASCQNTMDTLLKDNEPGEPSESEEHVKENVSPLRRKRKMVKVYFIPEAANYCDHTRITHLM